MSGSSRSNASAPGSGTYRCEGAVGGDHGQRAQQPPADRLAAGLRIFLLRADGPERDLLALAAVFDLMRRRPEAHGRKPDRQRDGARLAPGPPRHGDAHARRHGLFLQVGKKTVGIVREPAVVLAAQEQFVPRRALLLRRALLRVLEEQFARGC